MKSAVSSSCFTFFLYWKVTTSCFRCSDSNCSIIYVIRFVFWAFEMNFEILLSTPWQSIAGNIQGIIVLQIFKIFSNQSLLFHSLINLTLLKFKYETCMLIHSIHMSKHLTIIMASGIATSLILTFDKNLVSTRFTSVAE